MVFYAFALILIGISLCMWGGWVRIGGLLLIAGTIVGCAAITLFTGEPLLHAKPQVTDDGTTREDHNPPA